VEAAAMAEIVMKKKAYVKPLLHAAKYPHCAINGVLLAEQQKHKEDRVLKLVDAVPLLHSSLTLTPMIEVALCQVSGSIGLCALFRFCYRQAGRCWRQSQYHYRKQHHV
jgi:ER membrane protein complex subunit 8/9